MSGRHDSIRSYQRIFRPDRRIYQIEGRRLPVPGGVPLRWLGHATATLVTVVVLSAGSATADLLLAGCAGVGTLLAAGRRAAFVAVSASLALLLLAGLVLRGLDWPLRLVVLPALAATLLTQATPDGRPAHRYAASLASLWLLPARSTLGRPLPRVGEPLRPRARLRVASDEHAPRLRRGRVHGPAEVRFAAALWVRRGRLRRRVLVARSRRGPWRRGAPLASLELAAGERLEVRP